LLSWGIIESLFLATYSLLNNDFFNSSEFRCMK
jgi:hypothetical protein